MSILVVGSLGLDSIETPHSSVKDALGGSAVYISISASYFSQNINLVGVVGSDFPDEYLQLLHNREVNLEGLQIVENERTFRWSCRYDCDMNSRETLSTELNVFKNFKPIIPESYCESKYIVLGNIDPELQIYVLNHLKNPKFIICDTMNYWIERKYEVLCELLTKVNLLLLNDLEARLLAKEFNLIRAGRSILKMGPQIILIKKGEHGALMMTEDNYFIAPAYPLENIQDPTGAGDSFAGGLIGYIAKVGSFDKETLKRAVVYGSVMASFCVEKFSVDGLISLNDDNITERFHQFYGLTHFEV